MLQSEIHIFLLRGALQVPLEQSFQLSLRNTDAGGYFAGCQAIFNMGCHYPKSRCKFWRFACQCGVLRHTLNIGADSDSVMKQPGADVRYQFVSIVLCYQMHHQIQCAGSATTGIAIIFDNIDRWIGFYLRECLAKRIDTLPMNGATLMR